MSVTGILIIFVAIRLLDLAVSYVSPHFVAYLGFFPYKEVFHKYPLPPFIFSFANFDGVHYIRTALMGYSQYAQAFFPLYPLFIKLFTMILGNPILDGIFVSYISFFGGSYFFIQYLRSIDFHKNQITWTIVYLCLFPSSFFFGAVYNMSLFFCLVGASLYFFMKKRYAIAGILAFFAATTRLEGVLLIIPFISVLFSKKDTIKPGLLFAFGSPLAGLITFMLYLWKTTGDALYFLHSQAAFGAHRSSKIVVLPQVLYRYIKIFITAAHDFRYYVSIFEFVTFGVVFSVLLYELYVLWRKKRTAHFWERLSINIFSVSCLILPTLTGTLSSVPRYALLSLSFFMILGTIKNLPLKLCVAVIFMIAHIVMLAYFIQGYFVS